jgi:hypothetical protein
MPFIAGQPKTLGSGRKKGVPDKRTQLVRTQARTAIEMMSQSRRDPLELQFELDEIMREVIMLMAARKVPKDERTVAQRIASLPPAKNEQVRRWIDSLRISLAGKMQYRYPKLQQVAVSDAHKGGLVPDAAEPSEGIQVNYFRRVIIRPGDFNGRKPEIIEIDAGTGPGSAGLGGSSSPAE